MGTTTVHPQSQHAREAGTSQRDQLRAFAKSLGITATFSGESGEGDEPGWLGWIWTRPGMESADAFADEHDALIDGAQVVTDAGRALLPKTKRPGTIELANAQALAVSLRDERRLHQGTLRSLDLTRKDCATWRWVAQRNREATIKAEVERDELKEDLQEAQTEIAKLRLQLGQAADHMTPVRVSEARPS